MEKTVKIVLPNQMEFLGLAVHFVHEVARHRGFTGSALNEIEVAVEEVVSNVMKHAFDVEENYSFEVRCRYLSDGLSIIVKETGIPFDPRLVPSYDPKRLQEDGSAVGIGTFLIKAVMDEVEFVNLGVEGKETRMIKRLAEVDAQLPPIVSPPKAGEPEVIKEKLSYVVRGMKPEEAVEVSRCAFKSHGYSFFDDHIYYPEKLVEMNETGQMISAVAVTAQGIFMGHAALIYQSMDDRIAELTFVFVNVEYRGQGAFNRLIEFLFNEPKLRPLDGIYAYAVANHVFTQKATARYGINDCGIHLATSPASWKFKGIPGDADQRISVVLSFKYMSEPKPLVLYPPQHHRDMVSRLYRNIGAENHCFQTPSEEELILKEGASVMMFSDQSLEGCGEIFVSRYGAETVKEVRRKLRYFCLNKFSTISLYLNLEDPHTYSLCPEFEQMGFFFAGILPRMRIGDVLMLQYLNNVDVHYDKISTYSEMAKEILVYIQAHDPNAAL